MKEKLTTIGKAFRIPGEILSFNAIKSGNINTTYKVDYSSPDKSYVFQIVNTYVFKDPVGIMKNIDYVTKHIRKKLPDGKALYFHYTETGDNYIYDEDGNLWRVMNYIDSVTFAICDDLDLIRNTGKAFGEFQILLADLDGLVLAETIPNFHNTEKRINALFLNYYKDPLQRVKDVTEELDYIASIHDKACSLCSRYYRGEFPVRVTHNDTKANNVLFDKETLQPIAVIDLDTVMPGMALYDFGDAVRFIANTANEDEADLSKVSFDVTKFRAFCEGYISQVKNTLTSDEIDSLVLGAFSITVELASRFLDDYLTGDTYFKVNYPGHNLVRTRCQLQLARDIMSKYDKLCSIVNVIMKE